MLDEFEFSIIEIVNQKEQMPNKKISNVFAIEMAQ